MPSLHCFFLFGVVCDFQVQPVPAVCAAAWQGDSSLPSRKEPERCSSNSLGGGERGHRMGPGCTLSASVDACFFFDVFFPTFEGSFRKLSLIDGTVWGTSHQATSGKGPEEQHEGGCEQLWVACLQCCFNKRKYLFLKLTNTHVLKTQAWHLSIFLLMFSACRLEVPSGHAVLEPGCAEEWSSIVFVFIAFVWVLNMAVKPRTWTKRFASLRVKNKSMIIINRISPVYNWYWPAFHFNLFVEFRSIWERGPR